MTADNLLDHHDNIVVDELLEIFFTEKLCAERIGHFGRCSKVVFARVFAYRVGTECRCQRFPFPAGVDSGNGAGRLRLGQLCTNHRHVCKLVHFLYARCSLGDAMRFAESKEQLDFVVQFEHFLLVDAQLRFINTVGLLDLLFKGIDSGCHFVVRVAEPFPPA